MTYIELHLVQNFVPSNLNRDDTGSPKDCDFGGVRRARISSQCLKRAMRMDPVFAATTQVPNAVRTKYVIETIVKRFPAEQRSQATEIVGAVITNFLSKLDSKNKEKTAVLLYLSESEQNAIHDQIAGSWAELADAKKQKDAVKQITSALVKQFKGRSSAADIALFGRMLAENPELNIDAACQVAHALSTHRVQMNSDFYTAVDDLQPDDNAGAGMMGYGGYTSACFYRYALVDWDQLVRNLDGNTALAARAVEGFLRAAYQAVPSGKKNSTAPNNPPSLAFAVVRNSGPGWSLANAFEAPVRAKGDTGLVAPSIEKLNEYFSQIRGIWGDDSIVSGASLFLTNNVDAPEIAAYRVTGMTEWVKRVTNALPQELVQ